MKLRPYIHIFFFISFDLIKCFSDICYMCIWYLFIGICYMRILYLHLIKLLSVCAFRILITKIF